LKNGEEQPWEKVPLSNGPKQLGILGTVALKSRPVVPTVTCTAISADMGKTLLLLCGARLYSMRLRDGKNPK